MNQSSETLKEQPSSEGNESVKEEQWKDICDYLAKWYYKPDTNALAIALATYAAHTILDNKAVWLFVIGPSGTGKTELICSAIESLPDVLTKSDITSQSFISGLPSKKGGNSILFRLPKIGKEPNNTQGILVFKDFSSIVSERPDTRAKIMSQMREIWDGYYNPGKGTTTLEWRGKVTIIAAATPALERAWGVQRELGERFIQVRWAREDGIETAFAAATHLNNPQIVPIFKSKIKKFVDVKSLTKASIHPPNPKDFAYIAEMAAILRGTVVRDSGGSRTIIDVPQCEAPTRLMLAMVQIAIGLAMIFKRGEVGEWDTSLAKRIAIDSIPINRLRVINSVLNDVDTPPAAIHKQTELSYPTIEWICDELIALGALKASIDKGGTTYRATDKFAYLREKALKGENSNVLKFGSK